MITLPVISKPPFSNVFTKHPRLFSCIASVATNSSVDEVGERYCLNHAIVVKLNHPYTQFHRNYRVSHGQIATFSAPAGRIVTFCLLHLINTLICLLTY